MHSTWALRLSLQFPEAAAAALKGSTPICFDWDSASYTFLAGLIVAQPMKLRLVGPFRSKALLIRKAVEYWADV